MRTAETERADLLAYLRQREANCVAMAQAGLGFAEHAADRQRQLRVIIDEVGAGFHEGAAVVGDDAFPHAGGEQ